MFSDTITLFCRFGSKLDEAFSAFVLSGVLFCGGAGARAGAQEQQSLDRALVLIPLEACAAYVPPAVWDTLPEAERVAHWTLRPGDVFVLGEAQAQSPAQCLAQNGGFVITSVTERGTGTSMAHFALGGGHIYLQGGGVA